MAKRIVNEPEMLDGFRVVQDGDEIRAALLNGETIMHWEFGNSMFPLLKSGEYCEIRPATPIDIEVGDAVFCTFHGQYPMVHRCIDKYERDGELWFQIGTTSGQVYGWTNEVYGQAYSTDIYQEFTAEMQEAYAKSVGKDED